MTETIRPRVLDCVATKLRECHGIAHAVNGVADHIHVVATIPPTLALAPLIGQLKGSSSHLAGTLLADQGLSFAWQAEYGLLTVSEAHLALVVDYVRDQVKRHARGTLNATLEQTGSEQSSM